VKAKKKAEITRIPRHPRFEPIDLRFQPCVASTSIHRTYLWHYSATTSSKYAYCNDSFALMSLLTRIFFDNGARIETQSNWCGRSVSRVLVCVATANSNARLGGSGNMTALRPWSVSSAMLALELAPCCIFIAKSFPGTCQSLLEFSLSLLTTAACLQRCTAE